MTPTWIYRAGLVIGVALGSVAGWTLKPCHPIIANRFGYVNADSAKAMVSYARKRIAESAQQ